MPRIYSFPQNFSYLSRRQHTDKFFPFNETHKIMTINCPTHTATAVRHNLHKSIFGRVKIKI